MRAAFLQCRTPKVQRCASHSDYETRQALQNNKIDTNGYRNRLSVQRRFWYSRVGANLIWRNIKMDTLEIMECFTAEKRKHWLEEIGRCELGAGKYHEEIQNSELDNLWN